MYFKFTSKYQIDSAAAAKTILFKCEQLLKNQLFKIFCIFCLFVTMCAAHYYSHRLQ